MSVWGVTLSLTVNTEFVFKVHLPWSHWTQRDELSLCVGVCGHWHHGCVRGDAWAAWTQFNAVLRGPFYWATFASAARKWSTESLGKHRESVHTVGMRWGNKEKIYSHTSVAKERKSLIPLFHPGAKPPELTTGLLNHRLIVGKELKGGVGEGIWRERRSWERQISRRGQGLERTETGGKKERQKR